MLKFSVPSRAPALSSSGTAAGTPVTMPVFHALLQSLQAEKRPAVPAAAARALLEVADDDSPIEWSEQDVVLLHWRLLREIGGLADPETPLEEKFDTLRWVFTEREKDDKPFSFASCLRVVGCSPFSPLPYCGLVDVEEVRDHIRAAAKTWLRQTLVRYPLWVREAVVDHPEWVETRLARNPQWLNEEVRRVAVAGDLFA